LAQFAIKLRHGPNTWDIPSIESGTTVQQLYQEFKQPFNLPDEVAKPVVNGNEVDWSHQLSSGNEVVFQKRSGTKG